MGEFTVGSVIREEDAYLLVIVTAIHLSHGLVCRDYDNSVILFAGSLGQQLHQGRCYWAGV